MRYHIEGARYKYGRVIIKGWAIGANAESKVHLQVYVGKTPLTEAQIVRIPRPDIVAAFFPGASADLYGFRITFSANTFRSYDLRIRSGLSRKIIKINLTEIQDTGTILPKGMKETVKRLLHKDAALPVPPPAPVRPIFMYQPLISVIVPAYRTDRIHLREMIESVLEQTYRRFELCIADGSASGEESETARIIRLYYPDPRIRIKVLEENKGISGNTNEAFQMAKGEFIAMLDHDDLLDPDALYETVRALNNDKSLDFIYSDSDLTDSDTMRFYNPLYKPDWSLHTMYSANYITHFSVIRTSIIKKAGGWNPAMDGAQDWDLFLRVSEITDKIYHIPQILYHWRVAESSTARDIGTKPYALDAQIRAIQSHLDRTGRNGRAYFEDRVSYLIRIEWDRAEADGTVYMQPGINLDSESKSELLSWTSQPDVGMVMPAVLDASGSIVSMGDVWTEGEIKTLYQGVPVHTADEWGNTDWYRDVDQVSPVCYAVSGAAIKRVGEPGEDLEEYCRRVREAGLWIVTTPFARVCLPAGPKERAAGCEQ